MNRFYLKSFLLALCFSFLFLEVQAQVTNTNQMTTYPSLQLAINDADPGDELFIANGNYLIAFTIFINKELTIVGESEAGVVLNAAGMAPIPARVMVIAADDVTLRNMTIIPVFDPNPTANNNLGVTISSATNPPNYNFNLTLENITINGAENTPFDIHGIDGVTATNLTANNTTLGNGIQFRACSNVVLNSFNGTNNELGSVAVLTSTQFNQGSSNVVIDGSGLAIDGTVYSQDNSSAGLFNTDVVVSDWDYRVFNDDFRADGDDFTFYEDVEANATTYAEFLNTLNGGNTASAIQQVSSGEWFVTNDNLSIQAAIDEAASEDVVNVYEGTYFEELTITKSIALFGPNAFNSPNTDVRGPEAILQPVGSNVYAVEGASPGIKAEVKGFLITLEDASDDSRFVHQVDMDDTKWSMEHNIFTGAIQTASESIYFGGDQAVNFSLRDNLIAFNSTGNGFAFWSTQTHTLDIQGNAWEDNGGWALNLHRATGKIFNNTILDNSVDGPSWLDDQLGFVLSTDDNDLTIVQNTFENIPHIALNINPDFDGTLEVYLNTFMDIGVNRIDMNVGSYAVQFRENAGTFADLSDIRINENAFIKNEVAIGNNSGQMLDATCNWWDSADGPAPDQIEGDATTDPWLVSGDLNDPDCTGSDDDCVAKKPTGLMASNPTTTTIDLDWDDMGADAYEVYNSANFDFVITTTNSITLTGLPPGTTFNVGVRSICNNGDVSAWKFLNNVSTLEECVAVKPTGLIASNPTTTTIDLDWDDMGADAYEVYNSANFDFVITNTNSITLTGLPAGTTFNIGVRSICNNGDVSSWTFLNGVSTLEDCIALEPTGLMASNPTASTIDLDWDDMGADSYEVYNSANFQIVTTNTNSITLTGLPSGTTFNVGVRSICNNGDISNWVFLDGVSTANSRPWAMNGQQNEDASVREIEVLQSTTVLGSDVSVFPIPVVGNHVTIQIAQKVPIHRISLFNVSGEQLQVAEGINSSQVEFQLQPRLGAGMYLLRIEGSDYSVVKRIIVQ
jgi:hypothetical protein